MPMGSASAVLTPTPAAFQFGRHTRATQIRGAGFRWGATPPPRVRADARASGATVASSGARLTAWTYAATWNRRFAASFPMPRRGGAPPRRGIGNDAAKRRFQVAAYVHAVKRAPLDATVAPDARASARTRGGGVAPHRKPAPRI